MTRRPAPSTNLWLVLGALLVCLASTTYAHDIDVTGVARLILDERAGAESDDEASYKLSVIDTQVPPLFDIGSALPERCEALMPSRSSYEFSCSPSLRSDDSLLFPWSLAGVVLMVNWMDGSSHSSYFRGDGVFVETPLAEVRAPNSALGRLAAQYIEMGVEHILLGIDHLLFVIGLMLLLSISHGHAGGDRPLVRYIKAITAFTLAHSLTLGAAVLGIARLPSGPVEILIALSIILLAREAIEAQRGRFSLSFRRPWLVAFAFGLIHGFGFATALGDLGLNTADIPAALLFFNLGVEAGQLAIVMSSLILFQLCSRIASLLHVQRAMFDSTTLSILAYLLGGVATYWFIERIPTLWS